MKDDRPQKIRSKWQAGGAMMNLGPSKEETETKSRHWIGGKPDKQTQEA